jgi:hypothetical protein
MAWLRNVLDPPDRVREYEAALQARPRQQDLGEPALPWQDLARLAASLWGLTVGGRLALAAGWMRLFWWADAGQPANPLVIPLVAGGLEAIGALLTPFSPRRGGVLMLLGAASMLLLPVLFPDLVVQMSILSGYSLGFLSISNIVALVGPGILALLSTRRHA